VHHTDDAQAQSPDAFQGNKAGGFRSLTKEHQNIGLQIKGTIPAWLHGKLLGTGPARFELGESHVKYWFNGLAMLHAFTIDNGSVHYSNKFLESEYYQRCMKNGKFDSSMSTEKPKGFFSRLASAVTSHDPYDNGTIAIHKLHDIFVAVTETPLPVAFDPKTLKTTALVKFDDTLNGHLTSAQFLYDPLTKEFYNYMIEFATSSQYHFYKIKPGGKSRTLIASLPVKSPSYMRSFGMSKNYLILVEIPFMVNPIDLLFASGAFIETFVWKPKLGTTMHVVNKRTGAYVGSFKTEPVYSINTINAFEQGNTLNIDIIAHNDTRLVGLTTLDVLRRANNEQEFSPSLVKRISIALDTKDVTMQMLSNKTIEFPTINKMYTAKDYTYVYGIGALKHDAFPHLITKINIKTGEHRYWSEQGCYASSPVFVQAPQAKQEDEGVLLSIVFDSTVNRSFLLILDADTMTEHARALLQNHIPLGIMAQFYISKDR
jgi:beta,beta-carotene 9',10'-dioxygenase